MSEPGQAPPEAVTVFGPSLGLAERFEALLAGAGVERGLIGPREAPKLWERHLLNCAAVQALLPPSSRVVDLGSGAGLPGLVLAIVRPDVEVTLVEPLLRRTTFLDEVVLGLGVDNVRVVRGRAEELHGRATFDVVTARALAPLGRLLAWAMPLVAPGGELVAMKGASAADEVARTASELQHWGCAEPQVEVVGDGCASATVVRVARVDASRVS